MRILRFISCLFVSINIGLMTVYTISFLMLKTDNLSVSGRLFFFLDFPGYLLIIQMISAFLLVIYAIRKRNTSVYVMLALVIVGYFLFDYFVNDSSGLYNPV